jgi:hypothetical protein
VRDLSLSFWRATARRNEYVARSAWPPSCLWGGRKAKNRMALSLNRLSIRKACAGLMVLTILSPALAQSPDTPVSPAQVSSPSATASSQGLAEPSQAPAESPSATPANGVSSPAQTVANPPSVPSDPPDVLEVLGLNTPVLPALVNTPSAAASSQGPAELAQVPSTTPVQGASSPAQSVANTAPAQPSTPQPEKSKPILIVWAHTDIPDQGASTLDLMDLERYFVDQLIRRRIENVVPYTTANTSNLSPNVYLLDLSVKAMHPAVRSVWNQEANEYQSRDIFDVELSLAVKHRQSDRDLGTTGARYEHWFTNHYESQQVTEKRVAIYTAANELADRFTQEAAAGQFSETLRSIQRPFWGSVANGDMDAIVEACALGLFALLPIFILIAIIIAVCGAIRRAFQQTSRWHHPDPSSSPVRSQPNYAAWDQELQEAFALSFETNGFDDAACRAVAAARLDEILAAHASIETKEAERILNTKSRDIDREKKAAYAVSRCDLDKTDVIETLRGAEEWPYRVLQEAKGLAVEVTQNV